MTDFRAILAESIPAIDDDMLEYFVGMIEENLSDDSENDLSSVLAPFIEEYGLAADAKEAEGICKVLQNKFDAGKESSTAASKTDECQVLDKAVNFSNLSKTLISDEDQANIDKQWGFEKIRHLRNTTMEFTESGSAKYERKAEKEQRKWLAELESKFVGDEVDSNNLVCNMMLPDYSGTARERDIHVHKFTITFGGHVLLEDASLKVVYGRRYGLIGSYLSVELYYCITYHVKCTHFSFQLLTFIK